jgi:hypothetical protein
MYASHSSDEIGLCISRVKRAGDAFFQVWASGPPSVLFRQSGMKRRSH